MMCLNTGVRVTATIGIVIGQSLVPAIAQQPTLAGMEVNVIIGATAGGSTDGTTRLVGRFLQKYLEGGPTMRYRNIPGGSGVKGTNYFAQRAKPDGSYWMGGGAAYIDHQTLKRDVVKYDPRQFQFIGGITRAGSVFNVRQSKLANLTDTSKEPVVLGSVTGTGTYEGLVSWGAQYVGWNVRFVLGYSGTPDTQLAARRGEVHGLGTASLPLLEALASYGFIPVAQVGQVEGDKILARKAFPTVPTIASLVRPKLTGLELEAFDFWQNACQIDKFYALPPGTPQAIVGLYRKAFDKIFEDPEFTRLAEVQFSPEFSRQSADDLTTIVSKSTYPRDEINQFLIDMRVKSGLPATASGRD